MPENHVDEGAVQDFCADLKRMQRTAGVPVSALVRQVNVKKSQLYDVLNGNIKEPPKWDEIVRPLLVNCGVGDTELLGWRRRHTFLVDKYEERARLSRGRLISPAGPPGDLGEQSAERSPGDSDVESIASAGTDRPKVRKRFVAAAAAAGVAVLLVSLFAWPHHASGRHASHPAVTGSATPGLYFNEYDLAIVAGFGYDLDITPGQPPTLHATARDDTADYRFLDLYRTAQLLDKISGVDRHGDGQFNQIQLVRDVDSPAACPTLAPQIGGQVHTSEMHVGTRVCVHTDQGRWAQLTVTRLPTRRDDPLNVHVIVLR